MKKGFLLTILTTVLLTACSAETAEPVQAADVETPVEAVNIADIKLVEVTLPEATIVEANMDITATMYMMADNYMAIKQAKGLDEMVEPAKLLADYTSQAEVLAKNSERKDSVAMVESMHIMREKIAQLQAQIATGDAAAVQAVMTDIAAHKEKAHMMF